MENTSESATLSPVIIVPQHTAGTDHPQVLAAEPDPPELSTASVSDSDSASLAPDVIALPQSTSDTTQSPVPAAVGETVPTALDVSDSDSASLAPDVIALPQSTSGTNQAPVPAAESEAIPTALDVSDSDSASLAPDVISLPQSTSDTTQAPVPAAVGETLANMETDNKELSRDSSAQPPPKTSASKPSVSECKIQANRRNALRSTGPKTARGKRAVARNAVKHGILAREVVITAGDGKENSDEFQTLVASLWENYEPVGPVEGLLVQTIATCYWRKARALRAENGEIRRRLDTLRVDREFAKGDRCNLHLVSLDRWKSGEPPLQYKHAQWQVPSPHPHLILQDGQVAMREHPRGLAYLRAYLEMAKSEMTSQGHISENVRKRITDAFVLWDRSFVNAISSAPGQAENSKSTSAEKSKKDVADEQAEKNRVFVIARIDEQLKKICRLEELATEREKLEADAQARSLSLPPADAADKLLRYETHLDRQLQRAMDQLERLQLRRNGERVPPPLNINLGRRN